MYQRMPMTRGGVSTVPPVIMKARTKRKRKCKRLDDKVSSGESGGSGNDVEDNRASTAITCLSFGRDRKTLHRGFFFCGKCDNWEQDAPLLSVRAKRTSVRYQCEARHTRRDVPTQVAKSWCRSKRMPERNNKEDCSSGTESSEEQSPSESEKDYVQQEHVPVLQEDNASRTLQQQVRSLQEQVCTLKCQVATSKVNAANLRCKLASIRVQQVNTRQHKKDVEEELLFVKEQVHNLEGQVATSKVNAANLRRKLTRVQANKRQHKTDFEEDLRDAVETAVQSRERQPSEENLGKILANVCFTIFDGVAHSFLITTAKQWLRKNVYSPWRIARLMDIHGGALNLAGIELLRSLETNNIKYFQGSLLPSSACIKRECATLEAIGAVKAPFELLGHATGESIKFDYGKVLSLIIKAYKMHDTGLERSLRFAESIDGANLTKHITHVMAGLKINDKSAVCPLTNVPLFSGDLIKLQSRTTCFPLQIHLGKETEKMYELFAPMFNFFTKVGEEGLDGYQNFDISVECDLSATWKGLKRGGGAKVHTYPCHCCGIKSDDLHHPTAAEPCSRWCEQLHSDKEGWQCYHHAIVTDERLVAMSEEVSELEDSLANSLEKIVDTKVTMEDPTTCPGPTSKTDPTSIWFEPKTAATRKSYGEFLSSELKLRRITLVGNLSFRKDTLREQLQKEWTLRNLSAEVKACARSERALFLLMQAIPCVLHMEMRVGLKILTMLLLDGLAAAKDSTLTFPGAKTEKQRVRAYVKEIEKIINENVLGEEWNPSQWKCPYDEKTSTLGPLSMENTKVRKVMNNLELLIEVSVPDQDRQEKWLQCVPNYRLAMELARQKSDLSVEDVANFQREIDDFFQDWVKLHGLAGMTNYIHMLGSGHIAEYMSKWKNLYQHSQQGWEAFNSLLKTFFFRRTGRGGGRGLKSKLKPIARWLQRRLLWHCGITGEDLEAFRLMLKEQEEADDEEQEEQDDEDEEEEEDGEQDDVAELLLGLGQFNI